jgi:hypothetical protein
MNNLGVVGLRAEIRTRNLPHTNQEICSLGRDVRDKIVVAVRVVKI